MSYFDVCVGRIVQTLSSNINKKMMGDIFAFIQNDHLRIFMTFKEV